MSEQPQQPKVTCLGYAVILLFITACLAGAAYFFGIKPEWPPKFGNGLSTPTVAAPGQDPHASPAPTPSPEPASSVEIGIAYGTEKKRWLEWAVNEFAQTPQGRKIKVNLLPMGSLEGAQELVAGNKAINVWSPASALYKDTFVQDWQLKYNKQPILREEVLALSPMVFVFWAERYDAFIAKYKTVSFTTIADALKEPAGWDAIAQKPEWGVFKFGHTHPNESNSGLMTLVLASYQYTQKSRGLTLKDILDPKFQNWLVTMERGASGLSNSTGTMMKEMVLKGPASYDALFVYENVAMDFLKNAEGRWGELRIAYPRPNMWNDNPYYIIDAPWSTSDQRKASAVFLEFLLSEPIQKQALVHGFRPGNPSIAIKAPDSPFVTYGKYGVRIDLDEIAEAPKGEIISNILAIWQRSVSGR
ncbi:MAG: extracellular solute-binding protein [Candidatus Methylacidiphilales bacterium]|nr:extracellular solute-binding protein [Candidatus Methylacidiphilales bacterium]